MKMILSFLIVLLCLSSCNWILPIHSLSEIEPGLRKYVGDPSQIDTTYKIDRFDYSVNFIVYKYEASTNVSFDKAVHFFSEAFMCEPELKLLDGVRRRADFNSDPGRPPFSIMLYERIDSLRHVGGLIIEVFDMKNEIQAPTASVSDSIPPAN